MRRMYSEQELTKVIGDVVDSKIEDGSFDESIADYIDEYLVEHPVDITALEGKTIAPANVNATGNITGASIIENMSGYSFAWDADLDNHFTKEGVYVGAVKNGNKLSFVLYFNLTKNDGYTGSPSVANLTIPSSVGAKLYPGFLNSNKGLAVLTTKAYSSTTNNIEIPFIINKESNTKISIQIPNGGTNDMVQETKYSIRLEITFLLSDTLLPQA